MKYINRLLERRLHRLLATGKSVLLLGARQTGKTTLISRLPHQWSINLVDPRIRQAYEKNPGSLSDEIEMMAQKAKTRPLIIIDEIQRVPQLLDCLQDLIDRGIAQFIITGSSARKLRYGPTINWLPGRVFLLHLDPLTLLETPKQYHKLDDLLAVGSLPGITTISKEQQQLALESYASTYLEEEIRAEALVRNIGHFSRFLELAASESGQLVNFNKLSQVIGVSHSTITSYYQILEDCLIAERFEPYIISKTRRRLIKSPKYIFFDLGVRRFAGKEAWPPPEQFKGVLFEQWVGLECRRIGRLKDKQIDVNFWRDANGIEIDWLINDKKALYPIEVKWTEHPSSKHVKHIQKFFSEYDNATQGFVVCQVKRERKLAENIYALPWQALPHWLIDL